MNFSRLTSDKLCCAPKISVIVPTFNRAPQLQLCLESLANQTVKSFEVIVGDDGSTDSTAEVVNYFRFRLCISYFRIKNFGGPARVRNIAIRKARGKYLAFLDSDDSWLPRKLEVSCNFLDTGADLVYHDMYLVERSRSSFIQKKVKTRELRIPVEKDLLVNGNGIINSSVVVRRQVLLNIGSITEDRRLISAEDFDTWIKISRLTEKFVKIEECLGFYTVGSDNLSGSGRSVVVINRLLQVHKRSIEIHGYERPPWAIYSLARSYIKQYDYRCASNILIQGVLCGGVMPLRYRLIFLAMLFYTRLRQFPVA
jgi:glycosyltransferase involved in cell wall biosynthesis